MTAVLGISCFFHDSAAALVVDGEIAAAAQEERFSRIKHDSSFPRRAIASCLDIAGLEPEQLTAVVFYEKPLIKFERILETYLARAPRGLASFSRAIPVWLRQKLFAPREIDRGLDDRYEGPIYYAEHHVSHAASAFFPSPFEEAALLSVDGVGEWASTTWGTGRGNAIRLEQQIEFPHSLGLLYSAFTGYLGFRVNSGEYKMMGLAPYGEPRFAPQILEKLIDVKPDGSFWMDQRYFAYTSGLTMTNRRFHDLVGGPPRRSGEEITNRHEDVAASVQQVVEEVLTRLVRHVHRETGLDNLCLAGGVALNSVANGRIQREGPFEKIWVQPAAGDAGGALGAALFGWHQILGEPRTPRSPDGQRGSRLGPSFSCDSVAAELDRRGAHYTRHDDEQQLAEAIAELLEQGLVVGHFEGRMEFGPRALGGRSILADPRRPEMQEALNRKIKFRESFRPFAPCCMEERAGEHFDLDVASPYMLLVCPARPTAGPDGQPCYPLPAVTHVDGSARVQTVSPETAPRLHGILAAFQRRTGCPVLVNTSFNIRGEPIVATPDEAYRCFMYTDMDAVVLERYICMKEEQPELDGAAEYRRLVDSDRGAGGYRA